MRRELYMFLNDAVKKGFGINRATIRVITRVTEKLQKAVLMSFDPMKMKNLASHEGLRLPTWTRESDPSFDQKDDLDCHCNFSVIKISTELRC